MDETAVASAPELMTVDQLAAYLQLSESWVYRMTRAKRIPFEKAGKVIRFRRAAIDAWMKGG